MEMVIRSLAASKFSSFEDGQKMNLDWIARRNKLDLCFL